MAVIRIVQYSQSFSSFSKPAMHLLGLGRRSAAFNDLYKSLLDSILEDLGGVDPVSLDSSEVFGCDYCPRGER